jgi:uncharacterized protein
MATVARISITPVKALALAHPDEVFLGRDGVAENRRFYLTERGRLYSGGRYGKLFAVVPRYDAARDRLELRFPDGSVVDGPVELERAVTTNFWGRAVAGHVVRGPWADALSDYLARPVKLVQTDVAGAGYDVHPATLVSEASVQELGRRAGVSGDLDARRFRMLCDLAGCEPHEEDTWIGGRVRVGEAVLGIPGPVPRCVVTTMNPETGERDVDTLRIVKGYRGAREGKKIDFGVYGDVERPGRIRVGDRVDVL